MKGKKLNEKQEVWTYTVRVKLGLVEGRIAICEQEQQQDSLPGALNKVPLAAQAADSSGTGRAQILAMYELQSKHIADHLHNLFLCEEFNLSGPIINS